MRVEFVARRDLHEISDVADQAFLDVAAVLVAGESRGGPGPLRVRRDGHDEFVLQPMQAFGRLDDDARDAERRRRQIVVLDRLQRPGCRLFLGENRARRRIDLVERSGADELLKHRDMRMVVLVERKALRVDAEQAGVRGRGVLDHRVVRLKDDVDRRDRLFLRGGRQGEAE
jgi:hypothetical protein